MRSLQVRDAKAALSALIEAAERGEPTMITRHGQPAAVLVSVEAAQKLYPTEAPNFGAFLLKFPGGPTIERPVAGLRDVDL